MDRDDLDLILNTMERALKDAPLEEIDKAGGIGTAADDLWSVLEENGFTRLCAAETHGGLGAGLADALPLIALCGRYAVSAPFGDTVLACALLSAVGIEPPAGPIAVADADSVTLPHAAQCKSVVTFQAGREGGLLTLLSLPEGAVRPGFKSEDGAGKADLSSATVLASAPAPDWLNNDALRALGAVVRVALMSGAMQAALDLTLAYTAGREQFGRSLSKFQAIQHHLADMACETAAAAAAAELAADALAADPQLRGVALMDIAVAKVRCGAAAGRVTAAAHQAHGAMGFTREYALGRFTRRLWQWQDEFGHEVAWAVRLGQSVLREPGADLWARLSA